MPYRDRLAAHAAVSTAIAALDDEQLAELVASARPFGSGIGGRSSLLRVAGTEVFVKRVPLTDLERLPGNTGSTANLFGLPPFCQYGIGSPGFGVWREVAAHAMANRWVLDDHCRSFPLAHHWRVLPEPVPYLPDELADVDAAVAYWDGSEAVRARIEGIARAGAGVVLFLERLPGDLHHWLSARTAEGGEAARSAYAMVERGMREGTAFMNSRGMLHFDAHFRNVLTDGEQLYFTDFGLAASTRFALSDAESAFLRLHHDYDRRYTATHLVDWLLAEHGHSREERHAVVERCAAGGRPTGLPEPVAEIVARHAPTAAVMNRFFRALQNDSRTTRYPAEAVDPGARAG